MCVLVHFKDINSVSGGTFHREELYMGRYVLCGDESKLANGILNSLQAGDSGTALLSRMMYLAPK